MVAGASKLNGGIAVMEVFCMPPMKFLSMKQIG
jgi:hypothetical protein